MFRTIKAVAISCLFLVSTMSVAQTTEDIKQLAEEGKPLGQAQLASLYLLGRQGIEIDYKLASRWMLKSAEQGLVEAQVVMAALYDRGMGVKGNKDKATQWYGKAADQGHGTSLAILGRNPTAKGSVKFSYQGLRLNAARSIPKEYAKRLLLKK
jgi:TPR repeat protein